MSNNETHSPAPWEWTDYGVLSDANGEAIVDYEDWNVSPENAVILQRAPELYECLLRFRQQHGDKLPEGDLAEIDRVLTLATKITR